MSHLRAGFVLGFHGCSQETADGVLRGAAFRESVEEFDWLGPGVYFWEGDARRALEWADEKVRQGSYPEAAVLGAVIDLGVCLDLTTRDDLNLLADAYESLAQARRISGLTSMPENKDSPRGGAGDKLLRFLDCAVITHLHENITGSNAERDAASGRAAIPPFDTVRGLFTEGEAVYPGGGFYALTHTQIAVRNHGCIKGVFLPRVMMDLN